MISLLRVQHCRRLDASSTLTNTSLRIFGKSAALALPDLRFANLASFQSASFLETIAVRSSPAPPSIPPSLLLTILPPYETDGNFPDKGSAEPRILWIWRHPVSYLRRVDNFLDSDGKIFGNATVRDFQNSQFLEAVACIAGEFHRVCILGWSAKICRF